MKVHLTDSRDGKRQISVKVTDSSTPVREVRESYTDTRRLWIYFEEGDLPDWVETYRSYGNGYQAKIEEKTRTWRAHSLTATWTKRSDGQWRAETPVIQYWNVLKSGQTGNRDKQVWVHSAEKIRQLSPAIVAEIDKSDLNLPAHLPFMAETETV